jgi:hypothetical protein
MSDHQLDPVLCRGGDHPVAVFEAERHRLLDHDVLAMLKRGDRMTSPAPLLKPAKLWLI